MFFNTEHEGIQILDVLEFHNTNSHSVGNRNFHALSFRLEADTDIIFNGKTLNASTGMLAYFPPNCPYRRVSRSEHTIVVHFLMPENKYTEIEIIKPKNADDIRTLFMKILEANTLSNGKKYRRCELFCKILRTALPQTDKKSDPISEVKEQIEENFREKELTVAVLAKRAYMSEVTLRKLFKEHLGVSPKEYILRLRFEYALSLMRTDEVPISAISDMCGFASDKHFSTLFKKRYGCPPSVYKHAEFQK